MGSLWGFQSRQNLPGTFGCADAQAAELWGDMVQAITSIRLSGGGWGGKKQQEAGEGLSKVQQAWTLDLVVF